MKIQEARSLLTKFFYNANQLHFQILIQTESDLVLHGEYDNYKVYKTAFDLKVAEIHLSDRPSMSRYKNQFPS